jgi:murein DD-endopeptidase MepM/ murein hydrolase activator NlpD
MANNAPEGMPPPMSFMPPRHHEARHIVVRPGQSLGGLARAYHVSSHAIVAANHLRPPYKIEIGQHLVIPGGGVEPAVAQALPPLTVSSSAEPPPPPAASRAPEVAMGRTPDIIPLDGPPPASSPPETLSAPVSVTEHPAHAAAADLPAASGGPSAADEARAESASGNAGASAALPHGGRFPWPVRGRVLASYGVTEGGAHNDGINIAAPLGTPVAAIDGGVVAYAGNEIRGFGNLLLIKHADGFMTAYAHNDALLVQRGDVVRRGQVVARVGQTGNVAQPQLHFEVRKGTQAIDPESMLGNPASASAF